MSQCHDARDNLSFSIKNFYLYRFLPFTCHRNKLPMYLELKFLTYELFTVLPKLLGAGFVCGIIVRFLYLTVGQFVGYLRVQGCDRYFGWGMSCPNTYPVAAPCSSWQLRFGDVGECGGPSR